MMEKADYISFSTGKIFDYEVSTEFLSRCLREAMVFVILGNCFLSEIVFIMANKFMKS